MTSLLRFNKNQSYSELMSGGKGVAAITLLLKRILLTKLIFIFPGENQCLVPKMYCHHHHTGSRTLIVHLPFRLVSRCLVLLLLEVRAFEADWFVRLNSSLIEVQRGSSSYCHRCFLSERALTHCCNKCLRPVPYLLYALYCHL